MHSIMNTTINHPIKSKDIRINEKCICTYVFTGIKSFKFNSPMLLCGATTGFSFRCCVGAGSTEGALLTLSLGVCTRCVSFATGAGGGANGAGSRGICSTAFGSTVACCCGCFAATFSLSRVSGLLLTALLSTFAGACAALWS